jgi:hypothetical protein
MTVTHTNTHSAQFKQDQPGRNTSASFHNLSFFDLLFVLLLFWLSPVGFVPSVRLVQLQELQQPRYRPETHYPEAALENLRQAKMPQALDK